MGTNVAPVSTPILQFFNNAGQLNVGGSLLTQVGGVNYPTYQDAAGTTPLPNPIPLNSRGEISNTSGVSVPLYLIPSVTYTFTLYDANNNVIWVDSNVIAQGAAVLGQMTDELGSDGSPGFKAGTDFTPGVTTSLTLSGFYGSAANLWVAFDGAEQGADTYSLSGTTLTFSSPIPTGTNKVFVKGGTALTIGTPADGTVGNSQLSWGNILNRVVDSVSSLKALGVSTYTRAFVTGYYAAGDGGGGAYCYSASTSQSLANDGTIIASSTGTGCWLFEGFGGVINARVFGAKYDGVTDDTTAHINAIAWLEAQGGGTLLCPEGTSLISAIEITGSCVRIIGAGCGGYHDATAAVTAATIWQWNGVAGGTMVYFHPTGTTSLRDCEFSEIYLKGMNVASYGLTWESTSYGRIKIAGDSFTTTLFQAQCSTTLSEAADVQNNDIWIDGRQGVTGAGSIAIFKGSSGGNFSFNRLHQISGIYGAGNGIVLYNTDNNDFYDIQLIRAGSSGVGIILSATGNGASRANNFWHCSPGSGGFYSQGLDNGGVYPSVNNNIVFYDTENGPPDPVVGSGSTLWWGSNHAPLGQRVPLNGTYNQIIYSDGRMRYSGTISVGANSSASITFPKPFSNGVFKANATPNGGSIGAASWGVSSSTTSVGVTNGSASTVTFWWEVEGI